MKTWLLFLILTFTLVSCASKPYSIMNKGVAGNSTTDLLSRIDEDVVALNPDLAIVLVGTNDMLNPKKMISYAQFAANYQILIGKLKSKGVQLIVMSPPPVDTAYLFQRHNRKVFTDLPNARLDSASAIVANLAQHYELHFVDVNKAFKMKNSPNSEASSLIINETNFGKRDGVHPTREGYHVIAEAVFDLLKDKDLLKKNRRIVCFGDSITFGSFMEGAGTSEGDTYPGILKRMIINYQINACKTRLSRT